MTTCRVSDLAAELARGALATHRANPGLLRSAIKKQLAGEHKWERISEMGRWIAAEFMRLIEKERGAALTNHQREHISFSFMWLYGLLTQSVMGLNTILGIETVMFEREAVQSFERSIAQALQD